MKIYEPMLYVGLGGTGCRVGAELERQLRAELRGPDGIELPYRMTGLDFLPYQLPSCVQLVYADLNGRADAGAFDWSMSKLSRIETGAANVSIWYVTAVPHRGVLIDDLREVAEP